MFQPTHLLVNTQTNKTEPVIVYSKRGIRSEVMHYVHNEYFYQHARGEGLALFTNGYEITGGYLRDEVSFETVKQNKKVMSKYKLNKI
jgi:hypothetical protein